MEDEQDYRNPSEDDFGSERGRQRESRVPFYWILAVDKTSQRPVVLGPYNSEEEANRVGFEKIGGSFEVISLATRDPQRATKILKYKRFHQTARLEEALKRAKHQTGRKEENE